MLQASLFRRLRDGALALSALACFAASARAQAPPTLQELVLSPSKHRIAEFTLNDTAFQGYPKISDDPHVLWLADRRAPAPFAYDKGAGQRWLARAGRVLGHRGFAPHYVETTNWRGNEVWNYRLERKGIPLHGAKVMVHWRDGEFLGIHNDVALPLFAVEEPTADTPRDGSVVYHAERSPRGYRAALQPVVVHREGHLITTTIGSSTSVVITPAAPVTKITPQMFEEWNVPPGTSFPDQIEVDTAGKVWFSQPNQNYLTRFDPFTETYTKFPTTGGSGPDGMCVDSNDIVWTGLYYSTGLGRLDPTTGTHTVFPMPYTGGNTAIPKETSYGTLWVTDHIANRISEFDIGTQSWLGSFVIPTGNAWVVEGVEDPTSNTTYFACYYADALAYKSTGNPVMETSTPPGGPSFPTYAGGKIYYSFWASDELGVYDPVTDMHTTYAFPVAGEYGGPIAATPDGRVVVGTRNVGYIFVFDPATEKFDSYKIPTAGSGLKDGLTVAPNGRVWFTETYANKLARLLIH